ncbi:MAG: P-II family nitrogen regulator [Planctomycetaceae bacterium]|nr:P-II family nitrogen regulator [Planctomycetaceae bacterium]
MKKIEAIIRHFRLDDVKSALLEIGVTGITVTEVRGFGEQRSRVEVYRGSEYAVDFTPKILVEVVVSDDRLQNAVRAILVAARTGERGDGCIAVSDLVEVVRVRTGESGPDAL